MSQTKGFKVKNLNSSANNFLKSLLQVEDEKLTGNDKLKTEELLSEILIHSELVLDHIKSQEI